ncbi:hypothetical protein [Paracoccus denitrificans]|jgi:hypothetical protein|uniref:Uncharacterized protein n=1 Tax=Paracoccus denitrificans (strain Pd 1222) TaxID=318586 RepID=A1B046_PARDP|nr:hypothetical protein [Paracoccus denitrificans]ABL68890.1 conserved hypothetical protein [Paracoccus denitrificans PD1222]MBB4625384.1 hypothetical protein [Paracoccus denitrificans]MCU7428210.1 hypothetical protein [Paracoccus denitrificans]QAR26936.1 hypothetical protein EO213_11835 [Paracoccus denitrificans]UFS64279.1 hypothetical protein LO749_08865 [Paracoccus denitrificans]
MRGILCCLAALVLSSGALAGPWARDPGGFFATLSVERDRAGNSHASVYGEYGLSARNTLGFDLGHGSAGESSLMLWWQRALSGKGPNRRAVSLGLGAIRRDGRYHAMGQFGTAWGRGFDSIPLLRRIPGGGWLVVESRSKLAIVRQEYPEEPDVIYEDPTYLMPQTTHKLDLTLGWHARDKLMLVNQFRFEQRDDTGLSGKLAVSAVRDLAGPAKLELGVIAPLAGEGELALRLGSWLEF